MFVTDPAFLTRTTDQRNLVFNSSQLLPCQFGNPGGNPFLAGKAEVWRNVRIAHNGYGIALTTRITATAALCQGQRLEHLFDQRIDFNREFMGGNGKANAKK